MRPADGITPKKTVGRSLDRLRIASRFPRRAVGAESVGIIYRLAPFQFRPPPGHCQMVPSKSGDLEVAVKLMIRRETRWRSPQLWGQ